MNLVRVSTKVSLNSQDIIGISDTRCIDSSVLADAVDLSGGHRRTAVFMCDGTVFLIEVKVDTFLRRIEGNSTTN